MTKLRIFISWAGDQAETLGKGFRDFLPDVVNAVAPFISGSDIDKGKRWSDALAATLQESSCAIVCLTPESVRSIWVAFETGAISRSEGGPAGARSRIWTYLCGLEEKDLQLAPFAEYQATNATEQDTLRLLTSINQLSPDPVSAEALKRRFDGVFWPQFSKVIASAQKLPSTKTAPQAPSGPDIISEILLSVRAIQRDLRQVKNPLSFRRGKLDEPTINRMRRDVLLELATRGIDDVGIDIDPMGRWTFNYKDRGVSFGPGVVERGLVGGTLTAAHVAEIVARDFDGDGPNVSSNEPPVSS